MPIEQPNVAAAYHVVVVRFADVAAGLVEEQIWNLKPAMEPVVWVVKLVRLWSFAVDGPGAVAENLQPKQRLLVPTLPVGRRH